MKIVQFELHMREIQSEQGRLLWQNSARALAVCDGRVYFLGFSSEMRCVRRLQAVVTRLLKFVDEGAELREERNLTWR